VVTKGKILRVWDPRTDLPESERWVRLLKIAFVADGHNPNGTYQLLDGLRCFGASLEQGPERLVLKRGLIPLDEWQRITGTWIEPRRVELVDVLTRAKR